MGRPRGQQRLRALHLKQRIRNIDMDRSTAIAAGTGPESTVGFLGGMRRTQQSTFFCFLFFFCLFGGIYARCVVHRKGDGKWTHRVHARHDM